MGRILATSASDPGLWALRPHDLPSAAVLAAPHLQGLENNAVYRHLIHAHRRHRSQRLLLVLVYLGSWLLLGPLYGHFILGADLGIAIVRTAAILLVLSIAIANLYIFAGIEGYETNGWLKKRFFDLITAGIPAEEMVRGILGKTVSHYPPRVVRTFLICASFGLLVIALSMPMRESTALFIWLLYLGVFGAFQLLGAFASLAWVTIPGTLLWYRGVRRSYEQRLAEQRGEPTGGWKNLFRVPIFLIICVSVVLIPIFLYLYLGFLLTGTLVFPWSEEQRVTTLLLAYPAFGLAGYFAGKLWGWLARRSSDGRLRKLEAELDRLFKIRGDVLFGGG